MEEERRHPKRFDPEFVVFENSYRNLTKDELRTMFSDVDKKFNPNNNIGAKNYAQQFYHRKTGAAFSKEIMSFIQSNLAEDEWDESKHEF